jgi:membrane-bound lytic murein transglycosylase B
MIVLNRILFALALAFAWQRTAAAAEPPAYLQRKEVAQFIEEMTHKHGFGRKELARVFGQAQFQPAVIKSMERPAESPLSSWQVYRSIFLNSQRVEGGVRFWDRHADAIGRAAMQFGVPGEIIVAIIGVETIYGRNVGTYRVIDALATLAFDYPKRADFFREELENFLVFAREMRIDALAVKGSYAGAIGIPQFMPGSYRRFAVDYDGDGRADLAGSPADAIGSVGNFLRAHGWVRGQPAAFGAQVTGEAWRWLVDGGVTPVHRAADLPGFGVKVAARLPADALCALIELESQGQPSDFRVTLQNFFVLTRYNRSSFYATVVLDLAAELTRARTILPPLADSNSRKETP